MHSDLGDNRYIANSSYCVLIGAKWGGNIIYIAQATFSFVNMQEQIAKLWRLKGARAKGIIN